MTPADVEQLCVLMAKFGLTGLKCADVVLERPLAAVLQEQEKPEAQEDDPLDKLRRMSPEEQDRALALGGRPQ
jgi:hypothetical protein